MWMIFQEVATEKHKAAEDLIGGQIHAEHTSYLCLAEGLTPTPFVQEIGDRLGKYTPPGV